MFWAVCVLAWAAGLHRRRDYLEQVKRQRSSQVNPQHDCPLSLLSAVVELTFLVSLVAQVTHFPQAGSVHAL